MTGRRLVVGVVAVAVLVAVGTGLALARRPLAQPIAFSHQLHVEELGSDCTDCHQHVLVGARATIPNIEVCADCHEEAQTESPEEARVVEHVQAGEPIPWVKVTTMPEHVYFSHRRHAATAEIACETCHGNVGQMTQPVVRPAVEMTMDHCMDCHEEAGASNDCIWCHY